jgi:CBS domain containing-hemolysin-like protein
LRQLETRERDCTSVKQLKQLRKEKSYARRILPLVSRHHLLLVTLLLLNSLANECLPLFLDAIVPTGVAILLSVSFVLLFGEILPSAIFTGPNQLRIASALTPLVRGAMLLLYPVAWPISRLLDAFLGEEHPERFNKAELRALVKLHMRDRDAQLEAKKRSKHALVGTHSIRVDTRSAASGLVRPPRQLGPGSGAAGGASARDRAVSSAEQLRAKLTEAGVDERTAAMAALATAAAQDALAEEAQDFSSHASGRPRFVAGALGGLPGGGDGGGGGGSSSHAREDSAIEVPTHPPVGPRGAPPALLPRFGRAGEMLMLSAGTEGGQSVPVPSRMRQHAGSHDTMRTDNEGLENDEVMIMHGAMDLKEFTARDKLIPLLHVHMLSMDTTLTENVLADLVAAGHSRIPVYQGDRQNIRGILLVKKLIVVSPQDHRRVSSLYLRLPCFIRPNTTLLELINVFQKLNTHMAVVTDSPDAMTQAIKQGRPVPEDVNVYGIIALEDIIETLIREPINDETDFVTSVKEQLFMQQRKQRLVQLALQERRRAHLGVVGFAALYGANPHTFASVHGADDFFDPQQHQQPVARSYGSVPGTSAMMNAAVGPYAPLSRGISAPPENTAGSSAGPPSPGDSLRQPLLAEVRTPPPRGAQPAPSVP